MWRLLSCSDKVCSGHLLLAGLLFQCHAVYGKAARSWSVAVCVKSTFVPNLLSPVKFHSLCWNFWRWLDGYNSSSEVSSRAHTYAIGMKCHQQLCYENAVSCGMNWTCPHCCHGHLLLKASSATEMWPPSCGFGFWFCWNKQSSLLFFLVTLFSIPLRSDGSFSCYPAANEEASLFLEYTLNWMG